MRKSSPVWGALVSYSSQLCGAELYDEIELAVEDGLIDLDHIDLDDVRHDLSKGKERAPQNLQEVVTTTSSRSRWPRWNGGTALVKPSPTAAPLRLQSGGRTLLPCPRSEGLPRRSKGTSHAPVAAARNTRDTAAPECSLGHWLVMPGSLQPEIKQQTFLLWLEVNLAKQSAPMDHTWDHTETTATTVRRHRFARPTASRWRHRATRGIPGRHQSSQSQVIGAKLTPEICTGATRQPWESCFATVETRGHELQEPILRRRLNGSFARFRMRHS